MAKTKNEIELLDEISKKLDRLFVAIAVSRSGDEQTKIKAMTTAKFTANEIGLILGTSGNAIRLKKFKAKKK